MADVTIEIGAKVDEALDALKKIQGATEETGGSFSLGQQAMAHFIGELGAHALEKGLELLSEIPKIIGEAIDAARNAEKNINQMNISLALSGEYSEKTSEEMEKYASQLSKTSVFSEEQIIKNAAMIESFGRLSKDGLQNTMQAAVNLASIMKGDLDGASHALTLASTGNFMALQRQGLRFEQTGDSAKDFAKAIERINNELGGAAQGQLSSYDGKVLQLHNTWEKFLVTTGNIIIKSDLVFKFLERITSGIKDLSSAMETLGNLAGRAFNSIATAANLVLKEIGPKTRRVTGVMNRRGAEISKKDLDTSSQLDDFFDSESKFSLDKFNDSHKGKKPPKKSDIEKAAKEKKFWDEIKQLDKSEFIKQGATGEKDLQKFMKELKEAKMQANERLGGQISAQAGDLFSDSREGIGAITLMQKDQMERNRKIGLGVGLGNSVAGGASGAQSLMTQGLGNGLDALAPGLGQAAGPILGALFGGPEAVRGLVKSFAEAVPTLIENLIEAIPVVVEEIANKTPLIIDRLVQSSPRIIEALIRETPRMGIALAIEAPKLVIGIIGEIPKIAGSFITELIKGIPNMIGQFVAQLGSGLADILKKIVTGGGGGGGILSDIPIVGGVFQSLGFAEGGQGILKSVPGGFPNDSFPARLSSGELVVDASTSGKLKKFLDGQGNSPKMTDSLLVQILDALHKPMTVQSDLNLNNRSFAQIFLELSRTNQRLTA